MWRPILVVGFIGALVPAFWGVLGFLLFNAPEGPMSRLYWHLVHITCPPWLVTGSSPFGEFVATPALNGVLYAAVAFMVLVSRAMMYRK